MASLNNYEGICEVLDKLSSVAHKSDIKPKEALLMLSEIEETLSSKIRSKKLGISKAEKEELLNVSIPDIRKYLESLERSVKSKDKPKKEIPDTESVDLTEYLYDFESSDEDEDLTHNSVDDWESLNPDDLPYAQWLHEIGLREFFNFSEDLLYKIAAIVCLTHSAAIPGKQPGIITQPQLLKVYAYSTVPGTGKSTFCDWVGNHYLRTEDPDHDPFQTVMDNDSIKGLRDVMDRACHLGDGILREAAIHLDDFEPRSLGQGGIWNKSRGLFINVVRSQSISRVSTNGSSDRKEVQSVFYCWALTMMSSNHHPKELFSILDKMQRRCIILPFETMGDKNLGTYNWESIRSEYRAIWNKGDIEKVFWRGILRPLLRKPFSDFKYLKKEDIVRSLTMMAVGLFTGIFENEDEAEKHLSDYWEFIDGKVSVGYVDLFLNALETIIQEHEATGQTMVSKLSRTRKFVEISQEQILEKIGNVSALSPKEKEQRLLAYLLSRGYEIVQRPNAQKQMKNFFLKRF